MCPKLANGGGVEKLEVVRHNVGLRPVRNGGIRLERERIGGVDVIHAYGHGGYGYQTSWACTEEVVRLAQGVL